MAAEEEKAAKSSGKEGHNLLGEATYQPLPNGRFKCVETGHEFPDHARDSYAHSKRCRIGLIDFALANNNPLLNMFSQDPLNSSKLICKLTGDTINKSEEHIWKHMTGRRFIHKLEQKEAGTLPENGDVNEKSGEIGAERKKKKEKKKMKKEKKEKKEEIISEVRDSPADSDSEDVDFWMPPVGERWDFDDARDRWGSDAESESGDQLDENDGADLETEEERNASSELSKRTKRMSIEIGPSSFASRKKKIKRKSS